MSEDERRQVPRADYLAWMYEGLRRQDPDDEYMLSMMKSVRKAAEASPGYLTTLLIFAHNADAWRRLGNEAKHVPAADVTASFNMALAPLRIQLKASAEVTSPVAETNSVDYQLWAAVLLCVIAWLVYFAGPHLIAKQPPADQSTMNDYWSVVPSLALVLTGYVVTSIAAKRKHR